MSGLLQFVQNIKKVHSGCRWRFKRDLCVTQSKSHWPDCQSQHATHLFMNKTLVWWSGPKSPPIAERSYTGLCHEQLVSYTSFTEFEKVCHGWGRGAGGRQPRKFHSLWNKSGNAIQYLLAEIFRIEPWGVGQCFKNGLVQWIKSTVFDACLAGHGLHWMTLEKPQDYQMGWFRRMYQSFQGISKKVWLWSVILHHCLPKSACRNLEGIW